MWIYLIGVIATVLLEVLISYWCEENLTLGDLSLLIIVSLLSWFALFFIIVHGFIFCVININWDKTIIKWKSRKKDI